MNRYDINDGTTGAVCLLTGDKIYCANAGDTRIVLSRKGRAVRLTFDHKADIPEEVERIRALGGHVTDRRVLGILAVARSLGDFFLHPYVTADPYLTVTSVSPGDEFIILACDGVWDVLSDDLAC
jgi:serine/threonine protein phosphatase PrpC